jgi:ABC-type branched-subunit amino acid transport system ATPase component/ABC-type branched-subunit amino acid transport system permease subunit
MDALRMPLERFTRVAPAASPLVDRSLWLLGGVGVVLIALIPVIGDADMVLVGGMALIYSLFALSLNFVMGTAGLVSFGHAAYFGIGAYTLALLVDRAGWPPLAALALTPLIGALAAAVGGIIALRATELYFALLTLGLAQMAYAAAQSWSSLTGGSNGLHGSYATGWMLDLNNLYWFIGGIVALCALLLYVVTRSPFGDALRGIRENRRRAEFTGLWLKRYELVAFIVAGAFAGVAGGLFAMFQLQAYTGLLHWTTSALPVIMALIGGMGFFLGPLVGAFFYTFLNDAFASRTVYWDLIIGGIVLFVALAMPTGLVGAARAILGAAVGAVTRRPHPVLAADDAPVREHAGETHLPTVVRDSAGAAAAERTPGDAILVVEGLSKRFGGLVAVADASFVVRRHSLHAIIGPNGAGKTTLFNLITGLIEPDAGRVTLEGEDVTAMPPWRLVKRGLGRSFQQTNVFWALTSLDNVVLAEAAARGVTAAVWGSIPREIEQRGSDILQRVGLRNLAGVTATSLSHGDQRSLEIATALAVQSRLLLLDEPTAGLSPAETKTAVEMIRQIAHEQALTVLFIEHDMSVVFGVADWITVLHEGTVLAEGVPSDIRANPAVRAAYLGEDFAMSG